MFTTPTHWVKAGSRLSLAALLISAGALPVAAQTGYALMAGTSIYHLSTFQAATPGTFTATVTITGLTAGQELVGIDARPATGQLFALGYASVSKQVQVYTLNPTTGALTAVGGAQTLDLGSNSSKIGFDFNPTVDRIRLTATNGANIRLNPATGALVMADGTLTYATTDANARQTPRVSASAYTNSYVGSPATTLYNIDEATSRLVTQIPPNNGTLNTVGPLGTSVSSDFQTSDLDIYFNLNTGQNVAYLSVSGFALSNFTFASALYTVNLTTGATTALGALGNNTGEGVADIAFARGGTAPATITGQLAYALAGPNLITFDTALPGTVRTTVGITGVEATQTLAGLDVRPLTNSLYALGYNATAAAGVANAQVYSVNAVSGVATAVGTAVRLELGTGSVGFDFNPVADRLRVVGDNRNNYRLNPITGALVATDGMVSYPGSNNTAKIGAVAYTNSFAGSAAGTTLYNYDEALNVLNTQAVAMPPADGQLTTVGSSGITVNAAAPSVDLDIYSSGAGVNQAYLVANTGTSANTALYTVNLTTGAATLVGAIGAGIAARDIAIAAPTGVITAARPAEVATSLALYPNPLASATSLSFGLPRAAHVDLIVSDALGRTVDRVDAGVLPAGAQLIKWSRKGQAPGTYFFRLRFDGQPAGTRRAVLSE